MSATESAGIRPLRNSDPHAVGPYRLIGRLGAGGMGTVYAGADASGRRVAVKVVHPHYADDDEFRARFAREVSLLRRVRGTCTTPVLDADVEAEQPWFASEYVPGPTLDKRISDQGAIYGDELMAVAAGLAEALVALHDAGVVHRDLKPQNIILSPEGPRVLDLGIARSLEDDGLTKTGMMIGSPAWMSPERFRGLDSSFAGDVYAWAMLVAYAASGQVPFGSGSPEMVALRVMQEDADLSAVPPQIRHIVEAAAARDPEQRPAARDILTEVTRCWWNTLGSHPLPALDPVANATGLIQQHWQPTPQSDPAWDAPQTALQASPHTATYAVPDTPSGGRAAARAARNEAASNTGRRRVVKKKRPLWPVIVAGVAVCATVFTVTLLVTRGGGDDKKTTPESQGPTDPAGTKVGPVTYDLRAMRFNVPAGWKAQPHSALDVCVIPVDQDPGVNCSKGFRVWASDLEGKAGDRKISMESDTNWALGRPASCLTDPADHGAVKTSYNSRKSFEEIRPDLKYEVAKYTVTCAGGKSFSPAVWWLPYSKISFSTGALPSQYNDAVRAMLVSVDISKVARPK